MNKEVPVTYDGIMVGVAELEDQPEGESIIKVRLLEDSLLKPFFVDHTSRSISIETPDMEYADDAYYPEELCPNCDEPKHYTGPCPNSMRSKK